MKKYFVTLCLLALALIVSPVIGVKSVDYVNSKQNNENIEYILLSGESVSIPTSEFIVGAVAATMPASYSDEAIKAQAVCKYSLMMYLKNSLQQVTQEKLPYLSADELKDKWGDRYDFNYEKVSNCAKSVEGKILKYNGTPAMALTHTQNDGKTGEYKDIEYLRCVESPGDTLSPNAPPEGEYYGMSAYGADFMARQGSSYMEILSHYFPGTEIY